MVFPVGQISYRELAAINKFYVEYRRDILWIKLAIKGNFMPSHISISWSFDKKKTGHISWEGNFNFTEKKIA